MPQIGSSVRVQTVEEFAADMRHQIASSEAHRRSRLPIYLSRARAEVARLEIELKAAKRVMRRYEREISGDSL